ncbi:MAG: hypothetical protein R3E78_16130 [Burkholderiaceae bacterium]
MPVPNAADQPSGSSRPKFANDDRRALQDAGLTPAQLKALERALPEISDWIHKPSAFRDVADVLADLGREFGEAERHLRQAQATLETGRLDPATHAPWHVAAGHLYIAAAELHHQGSLDALVDQDAGDVDEVLPQRIDPLLLTRVLAAACDRAATAFPSRAQCMRRSKAPAIAIIERSLTRPTDPASVSVARRMPVSRAAGAPFLRVAEIVFKTVGAPTDPTNPIRELLAQRAAAGGGSDG